MNPFRAMAMVPTLTGYESSANPTTVRIQKEHPILFSGPMVKAILDGRKMQTRRVVKPQPNEVGFGLNCEVRPYCTGTDWPLAYYEKRGACWNSSPKLECRFGARGDRLWVKETYGPCDGGFCYRASEGPNVKPDDGKWHPSIFMFRTASRITLEITGMRVERLQDIDPRDCIDEGIDFKKHECGCETCAQSSKLCPATGSSLIMEYSELWDSINRKSHPWSSNPWVWVITFKRIIENS